MKISPKTLAIVISVIIAIIFGARAFKKTGNLSADVLDQAQQIEDIAK